jgi:tRNA threonylcarbamoyladenosine modification (KEOPS) complex  Pcc1 subunit
MSHQKRNDSVSLELLFEHSDSGPLSSSLITEADFYHEGNEISLTLTANSFSDVRARWNSIMRALIASEKTLEATGGGE